MNAGSERLALVPIGILQQCAELVVLHPGDQIALPNGDRKDAGDLDHQALRQRKALTGVNFVVVVHGHIEQGALTARPYRIGKDDAVELVEAGPIGI